MTKERAKPTLANRKNPMWGECELCGHKDILEIKDNGTGLQLVCAVCAENVAFVTDDPVKWRFQ